VPGRQRRERRRGGSPGYEHREYRLYLPPLVCTPSLPRHAPRTPFLHSLLHRSGLPPMDIGMRLPLGICHPARLLPPRSASAIPARLWPSLLGFGHPCSASAIPARLRPSLLGFGHPCSASAIPARLRPSLLGTYHLPSRQAPLLLPPVLATPRGDRPAPPPSLVAAHHAHRAVLTRCRPLCH
jgi:hypothetical protein